MSLDTAQVREYLARVLPWSQDETSSFCNVHWTFAPKDLDPGRKLPWTGRACRNADEAAKAVAWAYKNADTRDLYACMSAQSTAQEVVTPKGWKYHKPVRLAENATALKAIWLDLDAKGAEKNSYANPAAALAALNAFRKETGLPKPSMIVGSGGGFHVYWLTNRALALAEWYPLAAALAEAARRHELKVDSISTDAARVLRVPGTVNCKTNPPRPVQILARTDFDYTPEKLAKILEPYKTAGGLPDHLKGFAPELPRLTPLKGVDDLSAGIETAMPEDQIRACLAVIPNTGVDWNAWNTIGMRVYAACEGQDYGLALWQAWSDQIKTEGADTCESRWATFHSSPPTRTGAGALVTSARAATGDPTWLPHSTASSGTPPSSPAQPLSVQITPTGGAGSANGTGLLPATASPSTVPAVLADPHLPQNYTRDSNGKIWLVSLDDDGKTLRIPISEYPMTEPVLQKDPRLLHFSTIIDRGREQRIDLPLEIVGTNEMRKYLQAQGFMLTSKPQMATEFFLAWIKKLQETKDSINSSPFGWNVVSGRLEGFVYGGHEWRHNESRPAASGDPVLARQYRPTGDIQPWLDVANLITSQGRPAQQVIVATAFAAPLVMFSGHRGMMMAAWSQGTGVGKTTALNLAQAVWGSPHKAVQMLNDTSNSVIGKIGEVRSLPVYWDELKTEEDTKKFVNLLFQMTGGKGKSRMSQSARQREVGDWNTLLTVCSNNSLLDYIVSRTSTTPAGLVRIFEFEVPPGTEKGRINDSDASRMVAKLDHNYGQVGLQYAEFLGQNIERIDKEIGALNASLTKELNSTQEERFWIALIGTLLSGARYANELGVIDFDLKGIKAFLIGALENMRRERREQPVDMKVAMNVSNILAQFINAMRQRHTIFTNRIHITRGKPAKGSIKVLNGEDLPRLDGIYVHRGVDDKMLRISSTYLSEWLETKGYSRPIFTRALADEYSMKRVHGCIASGTAYSGPMEYLLEIDLAGAGAQLNLD